MSDRGCGKYACVDTRSPELTSLLFDPNPGDPDAARYADAPSLEQWLRIWLDGGGWYDDEDGDVQVMPAWADHRARVGAASGGGAA
jgi:hypothetical protein